MGSVVGRRWAQWWFVGIAAALLLCYAIVAGAVWTGKGWSDQGTLSFSQPAAEASAATARACTAQYDDLNDAGYSVREKFVRGSVGGASLVACYGIDSYGDLTGAVVLTEPGLRVVRDAKVLQAGGVWSRVAVVSSSGEVVFGWFVVALMGGLYFRYYRRPRPPAPGEPWWAARWVDIVLAVICFGLILVWVLPGRSIGRKARVTTQTLFGWTAFALMVLDINTLVRPDAVAITVAGLLTVAQITLWAAGRLLLAPSTKVQLPSLTSARQPYADPARPPSTCPAASP